MFTNASLPNILFDKMDRGLEHEKKQYFVKYHLYLFFFLKKKKKALMDNSINDLQVMLVESKYCTERDDFLQKR